jgi:Hypervirulence associated proteins TUDOR domain
VAEPSKGDKVAWNTSQGRTTGTVEEKLTSDTRIKGQEIKASEDDPKFKVRSDKTGAEAAHKAEALRKQKG